MSNRQRTTSLEQRLFGATVTSSAPLTPSIRRVTVRDGSLRDFPWGGFDHWFRLFFAEPHQDRFTPPVLGDTTWWKPYLAMPDDVRPYCANYTVADLRPDLGELDVDVVVHRGPDGELEGAVAVWACSVRPGDEIALLDQGLMWEAPDDASSLLIVADESGLPAVASTLRSLPDDAVGRVLQEVPTAEDRRELAAPPGVHLEWVVRDDAEAIPGDAALTALRLVDEVDPEGYAFVVGEQTLATEGRRHLHRVGLPKGRITFSGYWKSERR